MIAGSYLLCTVLPLYLQIFNEGSRCEGRVGGPGIRPRVGECSAGEEQPTAVPLSTSAARSCRSPVWHQVCKAAARKSTRISAFSEAPLWEFALPDPFLRYVASRAARRRSWGGT